MAARPFGPPDAAQAELDELESRFVAVGRTVGAREGADGTARLLFGRKGSGKSHYLRRAAASKHADSSVITYGPFIDPPSTIDVVTADSWFGPQAVTEWVDLWKRAILTSAAITILSTRERAGGVDAFADDLARHLRILLGYQDAHFRSAMSPYDTAKRLLELGTSLEHYRQRARDGEWMLFSQTLESVIRSSAPLYFFLDGLDDSEFYAPGPWHSCQRGLMEAILTLASDNRWRKIHVIACMRDTVVQTLLRGPHGHRYIHSPMLYRLHWDTWTIREFLYAKIEGLASEYLAMPDETGIVKRWLGAATVLNVDRDRLESLDAYVLRHTLLLPRDVVEMGNILSTSVAESKLRRDKAPEPGLIRDGVQRAAETISRLGIDLAAVDLARNLMPTDAELYGISDAYGSAIVDEGNALELARVPAADEIRRAYSQELIRCLESVGRDRFDRARADVLADQLKSSFGPRGATEGIRALWTHGMLGWIAEDVETADAVFYGASENDPDTPPERASGYAFHPSVIDLIPPIRPVGEPVYPEPRFLEALR